MSEPKYKEELTEAMHSEFEVDLATELQHRCITLWCLAGANENKEDFPALCELYGVTVDEALELKGYCLSLL
jgi:hypothetical protein